MVHQSISEEFKSLETEELDYEGHSCCFTGCKTTVYKVWSAVASHFEKHTTSGCLDTWAHCEFYRMQLK